MADRNQTSYSDLCHLLGSAIGKPEMSADGRAHTWTFELSEPPQYTSGIVVPFEVAREMFLGMVLMRLMQAGFMSV